jgi:hypothetical protein
MLAMLAAVRFGAKSLIGRRVVLPYSTQYLVRTCIPAVISLSVQ